MLHNRLLEIIASHTEMLDRVRSRGVNWNDLVDLYAVRICRRSMLRQ